MKAKIIYKLKPRFFNKNARASVQDTKDFIDASGIPLYHQFQKSKLFINPIIHGPPKGLVENDSAGSRLLWRAIHENKVNCFYVYDQSNFGKWYIDDVGAVVGDIIKREESVIAANLGLLNMRSKSDIPIMLKKVLELCNLSFIDIVTMDLDTFTFDRMTDQIPLVAQMFEELVTRQIIRSYGFKINVFPYNQHTPPSSPVGPQAVAPVLFEAMIPEKMPHLDLVIYPICPTTAIPSTYPVADSVPSLQSLKIGLDTAPSISGPDEADDLEYKVQVQRQHEQIDKIRIGSNYFGACPLVTGLLDRDLEGDIITSLNELCPELKSTVGLTEKAFRAVMSVNVEVVVVDAVLSAGMDKLKLTPDDINLTIEDTENLFGKFMIPNFQIDVRDQVLLETRKDSR